MKNNLSAGGTLGPVNKRFQDKVRNFNNLRYNKIGLKELANKTITVHKSLDFGN